MLLLLLVVLPRKLPARLDGTASRPEAFDRSMNVAEAAVARTRPFAASASLEVKATLVIRDIYGVWGMRFNAIYSIL